MPEQLLRPGDDAEIGNIAIMFTDPQGSTQLYDRLGDAPAHHLVRDHFAFLAARVQRRGGAIVKTVGDGHLACHAIAGESEISTDPSAARFATRSRGWCSQTTVAWTTAVDEATVSLRLSSSIKRFVLLTMLLLFETSDDAHANTGRFVVADHTGASSPLVANGARSLCLPIIGRPIPGLIPLSDGLGVRCASGIERFSAGPCCHAASRSGMVTLQSDPHFLVMARGSRRKSSRAGRPKRE